jgi:hypothetical protein
MSQTRVFTVNENTYNVAQASAVDQKKLMLLLGGKIALHSAAGQEPINTPLLVGALITLPESTFDEVASLVLRQAFVAGTNDKIDLKSFQGGMMGYFQLVAEVVAYNLNDFFTWLDTGNAERRAKPQVK